MGFCALLTQTPFGCRFWGLFFTGTQSICFHSIGGHAGHFSVWDELYNHGGMQAFSCTLPLEDLPDLGLVRQCLGT